MRILLILANVVFFLALGVELAQAQLNTRIWKVEFGTPLAALPLEEWVEPACGTNGGPPMMFLESFEHFAECPVEAATGLREVWFIYDDELEYIARAQRDEAIIWRSMANRFDTQQIITSLLIDDLGRVQGYRVVTDPRTLAEFRIEAYTLAPMFMGIVGSASWACADLPAGERETPIDGVFVKRACEKVTDDVVARVEARHMYKPGQDIRDGVGVRRKLTQAEGQFESSARLDVYNLKSVRDAPCCAAFVHPLLPDRRGSGCWRGGFSPKRRFSPVPKAEWRVPVAPVEQGAVIARNGSLPDYVLYQKVR